MYCKETTAMFVGHRECYEMDREQLEREIIGLIEKGVDTFLSGGMGQFDAACEGTVARLKSQYPHIKLYVIMPYVNFQTKHITPADELIFPDGFEFYHPKAAIQKRNRYMVDRSAYAVCYVQHSWGGAAQTLDYIKRKQIQCISIRPLTPENR